MSGTDPDTPNIVLPSALGRLLTVLDNLTVSDMPVIALIGSMAVNIRLSTSHEAHRAIQDVDVVSGDDTPSALEVLSRGYHPTRGHTVVTEGELVRLADALAGQIFVAVDNAVVYGAQAEVGMSLAVILLTSRRAQRPVRSAKVTPARSSATVLM